MSLSRARVHAASVATVLGVGALLLAPIDFWLAVAEVLSRLLGWDWRPGVEQDQPVLGVDKLVHFGLFFLLSWQVTRSWRSMASNGSRLPLWSFLAACGAYGVVLEGLQTLTGRTGDLLDAAADVAGVLGFVGWALVTQREAASSEDSQP